MNTTKQLKIGVLITYSFIFINIIAGLIYTPWMIGVIGQSNYGIYSLAYSVITLLTFDFGMNGAVTKFLSNYLAIKNQKGVNNFLGLVYKIFIAIDLVILIAGLILYFNIDKVYIKLTLNELIIFKKIYLLVFVYTLINFPLTNLAGILTAYEEFIILKTIDLFNRILFYVTIIIMLICKFGVFALVFGNIAVGLLSAIAKITAICKKTDIKINFRFYDKLLLKNIFSFTVWSTVIGICDRLMVTVLPNILAIVSIGSVAISVFSLANTLNQFVYMFAFAINGMFMPVVSKINILPERTEKLNELCAKVGRIVFIIVSFIVILFISFGKTFIVYIWHRPEYIDSYICAVILMIPDMFVYCLLISETLFAADDKIHYCSFVYLFTFILNILIAFPLCYFFNAMGASLSLFFALLFRFFALLYISKRYENLDMKYFCKEVYIKLLPYCIIFLIFGILLERYNKINNYYLNFGVNIIIYSVIFITVMIKFGFNGYEKELITKPILKILKRG